MGANARSDETETEYGSIPEASYQEARNYDQHFDHQFNRRDHRRHDMRPFHNNRGHFPWRHIVRRIIRPVFHWNWGRVNHVACTAEDSRGYEYTVHDYGYYGNYQSRVQATEDAALDKCYAESGGDNCYLVGCTPYY